MKLNMVTLALFVTGLVLFAMHAEKLPWTAPRIAGVSIAISAFLLFVLARLQLGRAFSLQAKATTLVTTGIYSRIRNPIYFSGALVILGIIIWTGRLWLMLFFAVLIPIQIYRIGKEEKALEAKFGAAYLDYKRKTWF